MTDSEDTPPRPQFANSREIAERVLVEGMLELDTPARFGGGQNDDLLDMPLLLDAVENRALLSGASIAGALRNYLRAREAGDGVKESDDSLCAALFGRSQAKGAGPHSVLMTHDALSETPSRPETELRDGVAIDPLTRTAEKGKKFDIELLSAGTQFKLRFELFLTDDEPTRRRRLQALAIALQGLVRGEIGLGARKRRGLGQCHIVGGWTVIRYKVKERPVDLVAWLRRDRSNTKTGDDIAALLCASPDDAVLDRRRRFTLEATFALEGSLLIRSGSGDVNGPDAVHLRSLRNGNEVPVLSGTSLAGVLRARALRILNTLRSGSRDANWNFVDEVFGIRHMVDEHKNRTERRKLTASRLIVHECEIGNPVQPELVQTRVKIDRFTGGAFPTGLFSEQPTFANDESEVTVRLELLAPDPSEVGLLLLLLKDLWTGDLPLGGESNVGRGRLKGKKATLSLGDDSWTIEGYETLNVTGDQDKLEKFVEAFVSEVQK